MKVVIKMQMDVRMLKVISRAERHIIKLSSKYFMFKYK